MNFLNFLGTLKQFREIGLECGNLENEISVCNVQSEAPQSPPHPPKKPEENWEKMKGIYSIPAGSRRLNGCRLKFYKLLVSFFIFLLFFDYFALGRMRVRQRSGGFDG